MTTRMEIPKGTPWKSDFDKSPPAAHEHTHQDAYTRNYRTHAHDGAPDHTHLGLSTAQPSRNA